MQLIIFLISFSVFAIECNELNFIDERGNQVCSFEKEPLIDSSIDEEFIIEKVGERSSVWMPELKSRQGFQKAVSGPVFKSINPFSDYDRWRYVTFYNVKKEQERLKEFPRIYEECQDEYGFTSLEESISLTLEVSASLKFADIGISGKVSGSKRISVKRNLRGVMGEEAMHTLYILSERWRGRTFLQTYNSRTKRVQVRYLDEGFFEIAKVDPAWRVIRDDIIECEDFDEDGREYPPGVKVN